MTEVADRRPALTFVSAGLLSKWGFGDGDEPDELLDWLDGQEPPVPAHNWHWTLRQLVREHLLPVLDQTVAVVDIETSHNPIRALTVDGVNVGDCWYGLAPEPALTPESVEVSYEDVLAVILRGTDV